MAIAFNTLLIPVDFSQNTDIAVKKAAELAGKEGAEFHLLHVLRAGSEVDEKFQRLESMIAATYPMIRVRRHLLRGRSVQRAIIECAELLRPDLIVIGKSKPPKKWFGFRGISPDIIAKKSNYPVLTVKPGSADCKTRVILIPIRNFLPERKLEWAVMLAKRYRAQVHLLAIQDRQEHKDWALPQVFLKAYHQMREHLHHPIEYSATGRQSTAKAALNCAELIMADMIVVNPETESGVSGIAGYRHISDLLGKDSKIQVLDIQPYKSELQN
ncbi:universal stress protein [Puia sp.]|uniref:universal stress protein n=1 Tax=Puia sp. TaxID=2045100 RepID=UPI002F404133